MYDYTNAFLKSELAYRTDRARGGREVRRGRDRSGRVRRGAEETRH